jgi:protocatechuate 3,4-dioxygenase beta subunit
MRSTILALAAFMFSGVSLAAEVRPGYGFDFLVNVDDAETLRVAANVPDETRHVMQVGDFLQLELRAWQRPLAEGGAHSSQAVLLDTSGGGRRQIAQFWQNRGPGESLAGAFSVCGERGIALLGAQVQPGRCADLPPLSPVDPVIDDCGDCSGAYEGMPSTFSNRARIAPESEPGEPLRVTGRVLDPDGRPRAGIIVYAYHTDRFGIYPPPNPPRAESNHQGRLRGWARTGADGRYTFDTIRPASYPQTTNPQHIHMHVIEPGCATYFIDEMLFTDDPMFARLSAEDRSRMAQDRGGSAVVTPKRRGKVLQVTRDIHLGMNIPGYPGCPAPGGG